VVISVLWRSVGNHNIAKKIKAEKHYQVLYLNSNNQDTGEVKGDASIYLPLPSHLFCE
jgi:hypothetical protein